MARKKHTTVILTEKSQLIKEDFAPIFGLKNILSAGLVLFGRLSADQKQKIIAEANRKNSEPRLKCSDVNINECVEMVKHFVKIKLPSTEEQRMIDSLRNALGPEPKQKRKGG